MPKRIRSLACKNKKAHEHTHHEHAGHPAFRAQWRLTEFCVAPPANAPGFRRLPGVTLTADTTLAEGHDRESRHPAPIWLGDGPTGTTTPLAVRIWRCRHPACFSHTGPRTPSRDHRTPPRVS